MLRAQVASFWIEDLECSRSWGSMLRIPALMATCFWRSIPMVTLPTFRGWGSQDVEF